MSDEKKTEEEIKEQAIPEDLFDEHTKEELDEASENILEFWKNALTPEMAELEESLHKLSKDSAFMSKFVARIVKEIEG